MRDQHRVEVRDGIRIDSRADGAPGEESDGVGEHRIGDQNLVVDLNEDCGMPHPEQRKANIGTNRFCNLMNNRLRGFAKLVDRA